jgi:hypothetical protein
MKIVLKQIKHFPRKGQISPKKNENFPKNMKLNKNENKKLRKLRIGFIRLNFVQIFKLFIISFYV